MELERVVIIPTSVLAGAIQNLFQKCSYKLYIRHLHIAVELSISLFVFAFNCHISALFELQPHLIEDDQLAINPKFSFEFLNYGPLFIRLFSLGFSIPSLVAACQL